jgi:hypothetical protein
MSRLTQNAIEGLLAVFLFALAITIAERAGHHASDQRLPVAATEVGPLSPKMGLH